MSAGSDTAPAGDGSGGLPPTPAGWLAGMVRSPLKAGLLLGAFSVATALILGASEMATREAIATRAAEDLNAALSQVIPEARINNTPSEAVRTITDDGEGPVAVFLGANDGRITVAAFQLTGYGYAGAIEVLMGVAPDGRLTGVRVLSHRETPGLGDKIEIQKDNWIEEFSGRSLSDPTPERWKVQRDGGEFDQFSGATITPRAVVSTVHRGLAFAARHQEALFAPIAEPIETAAKREER